MRGKKRLAAILAAQLAIVVLLLLGAETFVRCWREGGLVRGLSSFFDAGSAPVDPGTKGFFVHDPELGYRLNPETEGFNALSFRGPEPTLGKTPGRTRLLVMGDSVAWDASGFVAMLADAFERRVPGRVEVLNAAIPGYTTHQERVFLERLIGPLRPDVVVLEYCLNDNHRFLHRLTEDGGWLLTAEARATLLPEGGGLLARVARWSYLAFEVRKRLLSRARDQGEMRPWESEPDFGPAWKPETWPAVGEEIRAIHRLTRAAGAKLLVVAVPYEPQLDARLLEREREYVLGPQARLAAICAEDGIPFLDLEPAFEAQLREPGTRPLYRDKVHLTANGHALAKRVLLERLLEEKLCP
ncbi:MAG: SGNH/GDSL hydrolase family protein [Planctomycetota bacterium]